MTLQLNRKLYCDLEWNLSIMLLIKGQEEISISYIGL